MAEDPDLESRWRDWQRAGPPAGLAAEVGEGATLRPPGRRTVLVVLAVVALVLSVVGGLVRWGTPGDPRTSLPGSSVLPSTGAPDDDRPVRDLTSLASATADGAAGSSVNENGALVSYLPSNVLDGDPGTAWRTEGPGDGQTLTLELARDVTVVRVGVAVGEPTGTTSDGGAARHGRDVEQVTWTVGGSTVEQTLDPTRLDVQYLELGEPATGRSLTLRLDRTVPGPVGTDDFAAVTQVVVLGLA